MKKIKIVLLVIILLNGVSGIFPLMAQKTEAPDVAETVMVENIEVPVRVFKDGKSVNGLTKENFHLYINNKLTEINGFYTIVNKLNVGAVSGVTGAGSENAAVPEIEPRMFVFIFNLSSSHQDLKTILDLFFSQVVRPGDRLMAITNHYFITEWKVTEPERDKEKVLDIINKELDRIRPEMIWFENELKTMASIAKSRINDPGESREPNYPAHIFEEFFLSYRLVMDDLKSQFLNLPVAQYIQIAKYLKKQRIKKWVFNFYQVGQFPMLDGTGQISLLFEKFANMSGESSGGGGLSLTYKTNPSEAAQRMRDMKSQFMNDLNRYDDILTADIGKAFVDTGATFHTMLLKPLNLSFSPDFDYEAITTDTELILKNISAMTGGTIMQTNKIETFLKEADSKEDIVYMLTYTPDIKDKKRKNAEVSVKVKNGSKDYRVVFDDRSRQYSFRRAEQKEDQESPSVEIERVSYNNDTLTVKLKNIKMVQFELETYGAVTAHISVFDESEKQVADFEKTYKGINKEGIFKTELAGLGKGKYSIILEVKDLFSLKNTTVGEAIMVIK